MARRIGRALALLFAGASTMAALAGAADVHRAAVVRYEPARRPFDPALVERLTVADGFRVGVFASGLEKPRMLAVDADGVVYVTRPESGDVLALRDRDGDGQADERRVVASNLELVHGIALRDGHVYLAGVHQVHRAPINADGTLGTPTLLIDRLPDGGQHPNRTIGFDPAGQLYVSIGSTCNACDEPNPEHAAMLRFGADGGGRSIFARGLRNTIGFAWHPRTQALWGMDHGSDMRGDDLPPEELNRLEEGAHYGWPFCYGARTPDPMTNAEPPDASAAAFCPTTAAPALTYTAHAAPIGMVFYDASAFPERFRGDAFVAMHGSWNRQPPSGFEVVHVDFQDGTPRAIESFVSGFLLDGGSAHFGRPAGIAVAADGALLFSDDANGVLYRVAPATE